MPDVVLTQVLQTPGKEWVIPLTAGNVQFPVVQPLAETERLAEGFVRPLIMLILTVGSMSKRPAP